MSIFSDNLRQERELAQITQQDMAARLNLTSQAYGHYERGDREPNIDTLRMIAKALQVSIDALIGNTAARSMTPVERFSRYLESIGFKVRREGGAVDVVFHDLEKPGAKNEYARFDDDRFFVDCMTAALDKFKDGEKKRKARAVYDLLFAVALSNDLPGHGDDVDDDFKDIPPDE